MYSATSWPWISDSSNTLGKNLWESSQDTITISKRGKGMATDQIWWCQSIPKVYSFLLKCESISDSQQWNARDTPEMLCMLIAKLPGGLMNRWNRKVQAIRKKHLGEPDLQDLIKFIEEETILVNNLLFSRQALHEYTKHPEKSTHVKARKLKNCYTKAIEKNEMKWQKQWQKCKFCDGNHDLDDCHFYHEITVNDWSIFLKKKKTDYVKVVMQKSHQNIQPNHAQTEELAKYIRESIQQDYMVTRQKTRNLQMGLRLTIKIKLQWIAIVQVS